MAARELSVGAWTVPTVHSLPSAFGSMHGVALNVRWCDTLAPFCHGGGPGPHTDCFLIL